jgi:hypothetical protein
MKMTRVEFPSGDGLCVGHLRTPAGLQDGEQRPIIVYCAGMSLTKEVWLPPLGPSQADGRGTPSQTRLR